MAGYLKVTLLLALISFSLSVPAAVTIGTEALIYWTSEADYSGAINFRPSNGSTQTLNPPIFSWSPKTNHLATGSDNSYFYREYQFQVSTSATFVDFIINRRTYANMENRLSPFTNTIGVILSNIPIYWRAHYIGTNGITNWMSATRSFTVGVNATNWDRSMLANEAYLAATTHPYIVLTPTNRAFSKIFLETNYPFGWLAVTDAISRVTNSFGWTNTEAMWSTNGYTWPSPSVQYPTNAPNIPDFGHTLHYYALTNDFNLTNGLVINYNRLVQWYTNSFNSRADFGSAPDAFYLYILSCGYDWLYPILNASQRSAALNALDKATRYAVRGHNMQWGGPFYTSTLDDSYAFPDGGQYQQWFALSEQGTSHNIYVMWAYMTAALASYQESTNSRIMLDIMLNYGIARGNSFGGWSAVNQGRGYAALQTDTWIWNWVNAAKVFPEAHLERTPAMQGFAEWWPYLTPAGLRENRTAQADGGNGSFSFMSLTGFGQKLGLLTQNGNVWRAHQAELTFNNPFQYPGEIYWHDMVQTHSLWPPPTPTDAPTARAYIEDGWVIANTRNLNATNAFTNGIGMVFVARPRGSDGGHSSWCDGDVEIWCNGARVTDNGAWTLGDSFGYNVEGHNMGKIQGYGPRVVYSYGQAPKLPYYSRIIAFTNAANFCYTAGDLTAALTNEYNLELKANVTNYERHVFFSRTGKYISIFDKWATRTNSEFSVNWPVTFGLTNVTGSNFTYSATNFAGETVSNFVAQISSGFTLTNMTGSNVLRNPVTGVWTSDALDADGKDGSGIERRWRNHIWFRSGTGTNRGQSLLVVAMQESGQSAPVVNRIDDSTFKIVYGGVTETNTFGTNYVGAYTYRIELESTPNIGGEPEPGGIRRARAGRVQAVKVIN